MSNVTVLNLKYQTLLVTTMSKSHIKALISANLDNVSTLYAMCCFYVMYG